MQPIYPIPDSKNERFFKLIAEKLHDLESACIIINILNQQEKKRQ